jgi:hypothetical protein
MNIPQVLCGPRTVFKTAAMWITSFLAFSAGVGVCAAASLQVDLGYGVYQGVEDLATGLDVWRG